MAIIAAAYPNCRIDPEDRLQRGVWHDMLGDLSYGAALLVTQAMIATLKFPPTIADIREAAARSTAEARGEPTAGEAWAKVLKAIGRYGYYRPTEARQALGERLWDAVSQAGGWTCLCTTDEIEIISAQFERRYKAAQEQQRYRLQVPQAVQDHLKALGAGTMLKQIGGDAQ